jgi:hypothetical protein
VVALQRVLEVNLLSEALLFCCHIHASNKIHLTYLVVHGIVDFGDFEVVATIGRKLLDRIKERMVLSNK